MKKNNFLKLFFLLPLLSIGQHFNTAQTLDGILYGEAIWIANPTANTLFTLGYDTNYGYTGAGYTYENGSLEETITNISPYGYASADTLDVNNDGLTDFLVSGYNQNDEEVVDYYRQEANGTYTKTTLSMPGITTGKLRVADFNQDGYDDFIITGVSNDDYVAHLYLNNGDETFTLKPTNLFGNSYGSITIFDANNNGIPDVLLCGYSNAYEPSSRLYLNDGTGNFTEKTATGIQNLYFSDASAYDYDNDGDMDLVVTGMNDAYVAHTSIYDNNGAGIFTENSSVTLPQLYFGTVDFVDVDQDGDADILLTGQDDNVNAYAKLYLNEDGNYVEDTSTSLNGVYISSSHWADYDGDGDLDLVLTGIDDDNQATTTIYANTQNDLAYCTPVFNFPNAQAEPISLVSFNTLHHTSVATINDDVPQYEDFTNLSTTVTKGATYTLTIQGNTNGNVTNYITAYIDWNQDGTFSNSLSNNEKYQYIPALINSTGTDDVSVSYDITIPASALTGNTRMRIIKNYQAPSPTPCESAATFGQVEDYTLTVIASNEVCENTMPGTTVGDTGCITLTYGDETTSYTTVRTADNQIWLQQNLGSAAVATNATDSNAYGDLFQWGRWDDGHQKRNSEVQTATLVPNNPAGLDGGMSQIMLGNPEWWANGATTDTWEASLPWESTSDNGCDPCKALGENWSVPTVADWEAVIAAENITNIATAFESHLKLTVAGARSTSGVYNEGVRGYYWSKTVSDNPGYAKYLYYSDYIVNPTAGGFREQGSSVRCIYKENSLATDAMTKEAAVQLYPNPAQSYIHLTATQSIQQITIYDIFGKEVLSQQTDATETQLHVEQLTSGVYLVKITTDTHSTVIRFIKS